MPVEQCDNLSFWACTKAVIGLALPTGWIRICQLVFGSDGSIYIGWPDFRPTDGILSLVRLDQNGATAKTVEFLREGKVTSHLVKYSHHPSGRVHFSQSGKVRTEIYRQARFPLDGPIGRMLEVCANRPADGFDVVKKAKRGRPHLLFQCRASPSAITLLFEWRRKADVAKWNGGKALGPKAKLFHKPSGAECSAFFVGQPRSLPFQDHVLVVTFRKSPSFVGIEGPAVVLRGGADSDEVPRPGDLAPPSEFLAAFYPVNNRPALEKTVGSIDLAPGPTAV